MDKCELKRRILEDAGNDCRILDKLYAELNKELHKSFKKRDFDKIEKLTELIRKLTEDDENIRKRDEDGIAKLIAKNSERNYDFSRFGFRKTFAGICMCVAAVVTLNFVSLSARGTGIFSDAVKFTENGIYIDFARQNHGVIDLPTTLDDPYGIKAKCAEIGFYPETPTYLPEGFTLSHFKVNELSYCTSIMFYYEDNKKKINISYYRFMDLKEGEFMIPSDTHNLIETVINNHTVYILKEDGQFTATYIFEDLIYMICSDNIDYTESEKVLRSFC